MWGEKHGARHHIVTAWLKHQPGPDPVVVFKEKLTLFQHVISLKERYSAGNYPYGISAGMSINAAKCVSH
jgi:hypothetical protein